MSIELREATREAVRQLCESGWLTDHDVDSAGRIQDLITICFRPLLARRDAEIAELKKEINRQNDAIVRHISAEDGLLDQLASAAKEIAKLNTLAAQAVEKIGNLTLELAAARKDTERLDWLFQDYGSRELILNALGLKLGDSIREKIDTARAAEEKT